MIASGGLVSGLWVWHLPISIEEFQDPELGVGDMAEMLGSPRIVTDPAILVGKPVVRGTRLSVEFLIGLLADGWSNADILGNYPGLTHDDISACLAYARDTLAAERVYPSAAE